MPVEPHRVLVVEDDPACSAVISASLRAFGFEVTTADSALTASQLLAQLRPSAILLDLALPYRSGAAWLADLKADARTADIPVVIVSALPEVLTDERRMLAAAVVAKPFQPQALAQVVWRACQRARSGAAGAQERLGQDRLSE